MSRKKIIDEGVDCSVLGFTVDVTLDIQLFVTSSSCFGGATRGDTSD
jgi:hypothetical protein